MFIKSINKQNKELSLTVYRNNVALIHEKRETFKSKTNLIIEYHNISEFIEEASCLVNNVNISEVDFNYIKCNSNTKINNSSLSSSNKDIKPTFFTIKTLPPNTEEIEVYYLSKEIYWDCSYNIFLKDNTLDIVSWFNLTNKSGTSYNNATLKFVAGDINTPTSLMAHKKISKLSTSNISENQEILHEQLEDYYIYSLKGKYSISTNTTKKIKNFSISNIKYKRYYDFSYSNTNAHIIIKIINIKDNSLGLPLPSGPAYLYSTFNNNLEFIGGDVISNVTFNGTLLLDIGNAFDITCERSILNSTIVDKYEIKEIQLLINNKKQEDIEFSICYPIFSSFEIENSTDEYSLNSDNNPCFNSIVKANENKKIIFTYKIKVD